MNHRERTFDHPTSGPSTTSVVVVVTLFTNPLFIDDVAVASCVFQRLADSAHVGPVTHAAETTHTSAYGGGTMCLVAIDIVAGIPTFIVCRTNAANSYLGGLTDLPV